MSLDINVLKGALAPFFMPATMPRGGLGETVGEWVSAYIRYGMMAHAAGVVPVKLSTVSIKNGDFIGSLDSSLRAVWLASTWAGPGLVGSTSFVPPLGPAMFPITRMLLVSRDADLALSSIVAALHTYTLGIVVTIVPSSGTPFIATIT